MNRPLHAPGRTTVRHLDSFSIKQLKRGTGGVETWQSLCQERFALGSDWARPSAAAVLSEAQNKVAKRQMKPFKSLASLTALALALTTHALQADDDVGTPTPPVPPVDGGTVPSDPPASGDDDSGSGGSRGSGSDNSGPGSENSGKRPDVMPQGLGRLLHQDDPPDRLKTPELPEAVKNLVKEFETARNEFLKQQEELRKQLRSTKGDERIAIREQLQKNREDWLETIKNLREQIRDQLRDLRDKLHDARDEQLENIRSGKGGKGGKGR